MNGFFHELKRRKVYRVAIAYIVGSWALAQGISQVLPVFDIPNSRIRVVIVLLLIGFPVALVLAWMFDITRGGIERTSPVPAEAAPKSHRRRNLILLAAAGVIVSLAAGFFVLPRAAAHKIDKSIAVLPFENLSDEKENAYFADGVQDDILTNLSKIGDLKVISRTSVMGYRGKAPNVREIGKALGVSTILEGSVRRSGNRVRVNVQLIDATNDEHLWANDYDRDLTDVFAIQTDLAQNIANELQAKLSPTEKAQIQNKPTKNSDAYLAFVQAHDLWTKSAEDIAGQHEAERLYQRAIDLDPNFSLAYARASQLQSWMYHSHDGAPERREKARTLAERALQLAPDLPEAHLARGFSYYYGDSDYAAALHEFEIAQRGLPNESEVYLDIGAIQRRQGKWDESNANLEKAVSLNPNDWWPLQNLAFNYAMLRKYDLANKTVDRGLQINPRGFSLWDMKAKLAITERGDFSVGEKCLAHAKSMNLSDEEKIGLAGSTLDFLLLQHKYGDLLTEAESWSDQTFAAIPGSIALKYFAIGVAQKLTGDEAKARATLLQAKNIIETEVKAKPSDADKHLQFAKLLALLGEKERALAEAQQGAALLPESKDAFDGPKVTQDVAQVHSLLGDANGALELVEGLLNRPSFMTVTALKLDPVWDPIRKDPRFQALIDKYSAKA
jgi:TolB-like protein/Tfp pilus assembly protein PilF